MNNHHSSAPLYDDQALMRLQQRRFDLLKLELTTLALKIDMAVKNLWTIRSFATTLWSGLIAIGIGQFANGTVSPSLLVISLFMPAIFFYIDARYQTWYRRVTLREREIARFLNSRPYQLPREQRDITFEADFETERHTFPIYDLDASYTFARDKSYAWETSLSRQFLDSTPLSIYASQLIASGLIAWVKISPVRVAGVKIDGSYAFFAAVATVIIVLCAAVAHKGRLTDTKSLSG